MLKQSYNVKGVPSGDEVLSTESAELLGISAYFVVATM